MEENYESMFLPDNDDDRGWMAVLPRQLLASELDHITSKLGISIESRDRSPQYQHLLGSAGWKYDQCWFYGIGQESDKVAITCYLDGNDMVRWIGEQADRYIMEHCSEYECANSAYRGIGTSMDDGPDDTSLLSVLGQSKRSAVLDKIFELHGELFDLSHDIINTTKALLKS